MFSLNSQLIGKKINSENTPITIILVSFRNTSWIIWNIKLTLRQNKRTSFIFLIIDNNSRTKFYLAWMRFKFFALRINIKREHSILLIRNSASGLKLSGSAQHASALDFAKQFIETESVVILDPDCAILLNNWVNLLLMFLDKNKLDLFGTPEARTSSNTYNGKTMFEYKMISPCAYFLIGSKHSIFENSFQPNSISPQIEDTGYILSNDCLTGKFKFQIAEAFSTRTKTCEIEIINKYSCTYYLFKPLSSKIMAVHFGRGSNPFGKNRKHVGIIRRIFLSIYEPISFRHEVSKIL